MNAKTAQKHDYPSAAHRNSYNRRSAAERTFATIKDPATNDLSRGWCRLMGLTAIALFTATILIARNLRIHDAFAARQAENERRAANGLPPKQRKRRRQHHRPSDQPPPTRRPEPRRPPATTTHAAPPTGEPPRPTSPPAPEPATAPPNAAQTPHNRPPPRPHRRAGFRPTQT